MKNTINMFETLRFEQKIHAEKKKKISLPLLFLIVVIVLQTVVFGYTQYRLISLRIRTQEMQVILTLPENADFLMKYDALHRRIEEMKAIRGQQKNFDLLMQTLSSAGNPYGEIMALKPAHITLVSYAYADKVVRMTCETANNVPPADFAQRLDDSGKFAAVDYAGFSDNSGKVSFTIMITVK